MQLVGSGVSQVSTYLGRQFKRLLNAPRVGQVTPFQGDRMVTRRVPSSRQGAAGNRTENAHRFGTAPHRHPESLGSHLPLTSQPSA